MTITDRLTNLVEKDYQAARAARMLLEARNNLFDARSFAFSEQDDLCDIEENQAQNAVCYLSEKLGGERQEVLTAVDDLWNSDRNLTATIDWLCRLS